MGVKNAKQGEVPHSLLTVVLSIESTHTKHTRAQWGELNGGNPTNFELSVLLTTRKPADAAGWLRVIPLKLPRDQSPPGLEYAERYPVPPNGDKFDRKDPRAPFDYAFDKPTVFDGMRAKVLEQVLAAAQAQQQQGV